MRSAPPELGLLLTFLAALGPAFAGCGPSTRRDDGTTPEAEVRTLDEHRAVSIIVDVLDEENVAQGAGWSVDLGHEEPLEVDLRLATSAYGIEWVSPQDRLDHAQALPEPAEGGQLRIVPGANADEGAQILILEHSSYEFANEREHVQAGVTSAADAEDRLRRDVRDFLHYARGQGGL